MIQTLHKHTTEEQVKLIYTRKIKVSIHISTSLFFTLNRTYFTLKNGVTLYTSYVMINNSDK